MSNLNYKLENINNFEYNTQLYGQINDTKKNAHLITQNIININNDFTNYKNLYQQLKKNKLKIISYGIALARNPTNIKELFVLNHEKSKRYKLRQSFNG